MTRIGDADEPIFASTGQDTVFVSAGSDHEVRQ